MLSSPSLFNRPTPILYLLPLPLLQAGDTLDSSLEELGQSVEFRFPAPPAGTYNLQLYCMPDCWVGCDRVCSIKLKASGAHTLEARVVLVMVEGGAR